jgi:type VI secretion system protein ImpA
VAATTLDLTRLGEPISDDAPCGPDLDAEYDPDFTNFIARVEGLLPDAYFSFDRTSIKFDAEAATIAGLLERSRDLRLLVILAKLAILSRDLAMFGAGLTAIAGLLETRWPSVHPAPDGDDVSLRAAILQTLDDLPHIILPLQHVTLAESRRYGALRFRHELLATGEASLREDEETLDRQTIDLALAEADLDQLKAVVALLKVAHGAVGRLHAAWQAHEGHDQAVSLDRLDALLGRMLGFVSSAVVKRDNTFALEGSSAAPAALPAAGAAGTAPSSPVAVGPIGSTRAAADALAAVADYFASREPSNPALLLVRQAEQLIGKSFLEVMQVLLPGQVDQASIQIGGEEFFDLPLERLSGFDSTSPPQDWSEEQTWDGDSGPVAKDESDSERAGEDAGPDGAQDESPDAEGDGMAEEGDAPEEPPAPVATSQPAPASKPSVGSRQVATAVLQQVGTYFRLAEPSSPVPFLTDRARYFAERDFLSLLKDVLPESSLKKIGGQD